MGLGLGVLLVGCGILMMTGPVIPRDETWGAVLTTAGLLVSALALVGHRRRHSGPRHSAIRPQA